MQTRPPSKALSLSEVGSEERHVPNLLASILTTSTTCLLLLTLLQITDIQADTIYRCGNAYSASEQCSHEAATEINPASGIQPTSKNNAAQSDAREAQALEKQRLQAERHAAQTAPVRLSTSGLQPAQPSKPEIWPQHSKRKHGHKSSSPYFTAADPSTAGAKKKSTAKAVPATKTASGS